MEYNKQRAEVETLENHNEFYNTIKEIVNGEFILSSANPLNHITSLQNKIEVYIRYEQMLNNEYRYQRMIDAKRSDERLSEIFNDLVDSGMLFK